MTDSTSKYNSQISKSILGGIGDNNTNNFNIQFQPGQPMPYMLPPDIGDFTGREDYITQIEAILNLGKIKIVTIAGMGGVGKSALSIRVAYRFKDRFPDAQLYVNLHGQTPELALDSKTVLIRFLKALTGQDESQLATDLGGLVDQYRSKLADKRALIILDNALDEAQIRDLLPSGSNCAVVVTSRSMLTGLPGAGSIDLKPMKVGIDRELGEAELLFQTILQDGKRVEAELPAAREIVKLCGGLPIAIRITAATLDRKIWAKRNLQTYAQELDAELTRLDKLENEKVEKAIPGQGSVRASFNLSYRILTEEEQHLFRSAGSLPGVNFGLEILVAVMQSDKSQIEAGLGRLLEAQVLELRGDDRFGWHDLMRLFAKEQLTDPERAIVLDRGLTWYCERANFWKNGLNPVRCRLAITKATQTQDTADELEQVLPIMALNWFTAEQKNWVDVVKDLTQIPRPEDAVALVANLVPFFDRRSIWDDWVTTHQMVKDCAQEAGNLVGAAQTLGNLGLVYQRQSKWDEAIDCYKKSLVIFRRLNSENRIAQTLNNLGNLCQIQGNLLGSIKYYKESLEIFEQLDDKNEIAKTLNNLGNLYKIQGDLLGSIKCYKESLEIFEQLDDKNEIAKTSHNLGNLYQSQGDVCQSQCDFDKAIFYYGQSQAIFIRLNDENGIVQTLNNLGDVYKIQHKWIESIDCYKELLEICRRRGNKNEVVQVISNLSIFYKNLGDLAKTIDCYEELLEIYRQRRNENKVVNILHYLKNFYQRKGKWAKAIKCHEELFEIYRQRGDKDTVELILGDLETVKDKRKKSKRQHDSERKRTS